MNQVQPDPNTQIELKLPLGAVNVILGALDELPHKVVNQLVGFIRSVTAEQLKPRLGSEDRPLTEGDSAADITGDPRPSRG